MTVRDYALNDCPREIRKCYKSDPYNALERELSKTLQCKVAGVAPGERFYKAWFFDDGGLSSVRLMVLDGKAEGQRAR